MDDNARFGELRSVLGRGPVHMPELVGHLSGFVDPELGAIACQRVLRAAGREALLISPALITLWLDQVQQELVTIRAWSEALIDLSMSASGNLSGPLMFQGRACSGAEPFEGAGGFDLGEGVSAVRIKIQAAETIPSHRAPAQVCRWLHGLPGEIVAMVGRAHGDDAPVTLLLRTVFERVTRSDLAHRQAIATDRPRSPRRPRRPRRHRGPW